METENVRPHATLGYNPDCRQPIRVGFSSRQGCCGPNEDFCVVENALSFVAISDGMGGAPFGDVASRVACNAAAEGFRIYGDVSKAFRHASDAVAQVMGWMGSEGANSGATLLMASYDGFALRLSWAGDTLAFLARNGALIRLTVPDRSGESNAITAGVGAWRNPEFHCSSVGFQPGDRILLCTDGIWASGLSERDLLKGLASQDNPGLAALAIVDNARVMGNDDATAVVLVVSPSNSF